MKPYLLLINTFNEWDMATQSALRSISFTTIDAAGRLTICLAQEGVRKLLRHRGNDWLLLKLLEELDGLYDCSEDLD